MTKQGEEKRLTTGTIFCKDGTVRIIRSFLSNYSELGRDIEGRNFLSSTVDSAEGEGIIVKEAKPRRDANETLNLKAEKHAFKQLLILKYPELAAQGLSAGQIWKKTYARSGKTN